MKLISNSLYHSALIFLAVLITLVSISCSNPEGDFKKAKSENTVESLEGFIKAYPESNYVKEAQQIIYDLAFSEAKSINTIEALEGYIGKYPQSGHVDEAKSHIMNIAYNNALGINTKKAYKDFINKYNPPDDYRLKINDKIKYKRKCLQLAIQTHCLAQQEPDDSKQKKLFKKTSELFKKANFKEAMLEMSGFPLLNVHLAEKSTLKKVVDRPFRITRYIYGSATDKYEYLVKNEELNTYTLYNFVLASAGKTNFVVRVILNRGSKKIVICKNKLAVHTKYYTSYSGLMKNKNISLRKGDKIILEFDSKGDNFGTACGNFESYIKIFKPKKEVSGDILSERDNALDWVISNYKNNYPSNTLIAFIAQIDHCILESRNGEWSIGSGIVKNETPHLVKWHNNTFTAEVLETEKAKNLGKMSVKFNSN
jgi:outer membrane protein assembly factor BamD (BamD/ComL family)